MTTQERARWNERYRAGGGAREPNPRLAKYLDRLRPGLALDLAGGQGHNGDLLRGWTRVLADISDEALARAAGLRVVAESPALPFPAETFDTVLCTYFLDRQVDLARLLKPGGTLFFETYTLADAKYRPDFPAGFRLDPDEIPTLFRGLDTALWIETDDGAHVFGTYIGVKR
jgi:SAM-dependent methyltransferase